MLVYNIHTYCFMPVDLCMLLLRIIVSQNSHVFDSYRHTKNYAYLQYRNPRPNFCFGAERVEYLAFKQKVMGLGHGQVMFFLAKHA